MRSRFLVGAAVLACASAQANAEAIYGLTLSNSLVVFDSATPGVVGAPIAVTGLGTGQTLVGIDFRPADRQLVGVASAGAGGAVYSIDPFTGAATQINTIAALTGTAFGVDFNPVPNALRIVSDAGQNLRIVAGGTGTVNTDTPLNPGNPNVVGAAYTNNVPGGINGQTTLYVIDSASDQLLTQGSVNFPPGTSPNTGTLFPVGVLGFNTSDLVGFDISRDTGVAFASLTTPGAGSQLFTINLGSGAATLVGSIGGIAGGLPLRDITVSQVVPEPGSLALLALGLLGVAGLRRGARG
jgi:hypothetical protein